MTRLAGRIGLIGDVHGEDALLERALESLRDAGATRVLCTGDVADGAGDVARCCELLRRHGVLTVRGNHDRWLLEDRVRDLADATRRDALTDEARGFLASLPVTARFESPLGGVLLCHGLGASDMGAVGADDDGYALETNDDLHALLADATCALVFNGHTHRPLVRHFEGLVVVNAGTLHREHEPGFVVVDFDAESAWWSSLENGSRATVQLGQLSLRALA